MYSHAGTDFGYAALSFNTDTVTEGFVKLKTGIGSVELEEYDARFAGPMIPASGIAQIKFDDAAVAALRQV